MRDLFVVAKFTIKDMVKRKSFIISTLIILTFIVVGFNVPNLIKSFNGDNSGDKLLIIDSKNVFEGTLENLKQMDLGYEFEITNEDGEKEIALKLDKSMGVTKFLTTYGDPFDLAKVLVTKFNLEEYLKREKERLMKKGMTSNEADKYLEDLQKSWTQLTDYGTEVHKLFESVINPEIEYTPKLLNEEQVSLLQNQLRDFIEDTKEKFGRDCKFITEIPIVSEDIAEPYKAAGLNSIVSSWFRFF